MDDSPSGGFVHGQQVKANRQSHCGYQRPDRAPKPFFAFKGSLSCVPDPDPGEAAGLKDFFSAWVVSRPRWTNDHFRMVLSSNAVTGIQDAVLRKIFILTASWARLCVHSDPRTACMLRNPLKSRLPGGQIGWARADTMVMMALTAAWVAGSQGQPLVTMGIQNACPMVWVWSPGCRNSGWFMPPPLFHSPKLDGLNSTQKSFKC